jgi:hypothetical protein
MGKLYEALDERLARFIERQHVFFVATAPLAGEGLINLSPKGLDSFRVLGPRSVAWLDLTGSGAETIAHLRENGRIVVMFCSFDGPPNILRLQGRGEVIEPHGAEFETLRAQFPKHPGTRSVIRVAVERIADSCGYAVPLLRFEGERSALLEWAERKSPEELAEYQQTKNTLSLDGLPALSKRGL